MIVLELFLEVKDLESPSGKLGFFDDAFGMISVERISSFSIEPRDRNYAVRMVGACIVRSILD